LVDNSKLTGYITINAFYTETLHVFIRIWNCEIRLGYA